MIIGIAGKIGSGKDTVASIAKELYPVANFQIKGFADKLRQIASLFLGIPANELKNQDTKNLVLGSEWENPPDRGFMHKGEISVRQFLQRLGTDAIRDNLHENAWVNALLCDYRPMMIGGTASYQNGNSYDQYIERFPNWIITDVRFQNELTAIKAAGGICVRIVRPNNPHQQSNHPSETALDYEELQTIINDGSIEQLKGRVKEVFDPIANRIHSGDFSFLKHLPDSQ